MYEVTKSYIFQKMNNIQAICSKSRELNRQKTENLGYIIKIKLKLIKIYQYVFLM